MTGKAIDSSAGGCLILILPIAFLIIFLFAAWPLLLLLAVLTIGWNVWQSYRWQKWSQQVNPIFHQLIQENRGSVTALDLAMKAGFSAETAKRYLDTKAQEYSAQRQDDADRGTVYYFITASTLGSIFDDSEPPSQLYQQDRGGRISAEALRETQLDDSEARRLARDEMSSLEAEELQLLQQDPILPASNIPNPSQATPNQAAPPLEKQLVFGSLIQSELAKRFDVHSSTIYKRRDDPDFPEWSRSRDPEGIAWKYSPETKEFFPLEEESSD